MTGGASASPREGPTADAIPGRERSPCCSGSVHPLALSARSGPGAATSSLRVRSHLGTSQLRPSSLPPGRGGEKQAPGPGFPLRPTPPPLPLSELSYWGTNSADALSGSRPPAFGGESGRSLFYIILSKQEIEDKVNLIRMHSPPPTHRSKCKSKKLSKQSGSVGLRPQTPPGN